MSEKMTEYLTRFKIADYPSDILDTLTGEKYTMSSYAPHMERICDLLNKQSEDCFKLQKENKSLYDENIQLRKKLLDFLHLKDAVKYLDEKGVW